MSSVDPPASVVVVTYRTSHLDLRWVPPQFERIVIEHDDQLISVDANGPVRRQTGPNVGFGAGANRGASMAVGRRLIFANPDVAVGPDTAEILAACGADDVATVALVDGDGRPTSVVSPYPTWFTLVLTAYRAGRLAPRGGRFRSCLARLLGSWGDQHESLMKERSGTWPLSERWVSGALVSIDRVRFLDAGGFDEAFFLYLEDTDLCGRLSRAHPEMQARMIEAMPSRHAVSSSSRGDGRRAADLAYARSALTFATSRNGGGWAAARLLIFARAAYLQARL